MSRSRVSTLLGLCLSFLPAVAAADPVVLTGTEFVGVSVSGHVAYDPSAPSGNFQAGPVAGSNSVGYDVSMTADANNVYFLVQANPSQGSDGFSGQNGNNAFTNLYLSTTGTGTNIGIEVGPSTTTGKGQINDFFVPGMNGSYAVPAGDSDVNFTKGTYSATNTGGTGDSFEIGISWSFFTTNPDAIPNFATLAPGGIFQVRDSQSFGYTYVGGPNFGPNSDSRLAQITYVGPAVTPEPSSLVMVSIAGVAGLVYSRRRKRASA